MAEKLVKLQLIGITNTQIDEGAYALILGEEGGRRRIPVVVGLPEAQSIAAWLEHTRLSRPLTHELFVTSAKAFGIRVERVVITKFENGVFRSELVMRQDDREVAVDSRTSDAIAIGIRMNADIYAAEKVVAATCFVAEDLLPKQRRLPRKPFGGLPLSRLSDNELEHMMLKYAKNEEYEKAAKIKAALEEKHRHQENTEK